MEIKNNTSYTYLNSKKAIACIKFTDYIYLIARIGNGVMLQNQVERFMKHYLQISNKTVYRHLKELEANDIISIQKINKVNLIALRKYAYRFIKQEETGQEIKSKDISSPRVTEGKIKKSVWIAEYILRVVIIKNKDINDIMMLIDCLYNTTTLITSKADYITCFDTYIQNENINFTVRKNLKFEVDKINNMRSITKSNLAAESKIKNSNITNPKQTKSKRSETTFSFNSMFYNNLYVTDVTNSEINITFLDVSNILNESKMEWIIENIYNYFYVNLTSYAEKYEVKSDINVTIQILGDTESQTIKVREILKQKKAILEEKADLMQITKKELNVLDMLTKMNIRFNFLDISKNCFKNANIIF